MSGYSDCVDVDGLDFDELEDKEALGFDSPDEEGVHSSGHGDETAGGEELLESTGFPPSIYKWKDSRQ